MAQVKPQQVLESQKKQGGLKGREAQNAQNAQTGKPLFPLMTRSREQVLDMLKTNPDIWHKFQLLTNEFQEELIGFSMGSSGLKISYDPFFKLVFDPDVHNDRLSMMLSCIMKQKVAVKRVLSPESNRITAEGSLLIMDVLAELESGELVNIEIQRIGYAFPGERAACYSSDLILRQYSRIKGRKENGSTYKKLQNVYTIVLIENSSADFHKIAGQYIHRSSQVFDTGLQLDLLQKYIFVALDVFREITYNLNEEIEAWLLFLSSDRPEDIMRIIERYPDFREIYEEIAQFQVKPEELVGMYSKALEILDRNTVQYMIEEQKQEIEEQQREIEERKREIVEQQREIEERKREMEEQQQEIEEHKREMEEQQREIEEHKREIEEQQKEIERLKKLLEQR
jgi:hypothetical protein